MLILCHKRAIKLMAAHPIHHRATGQSPPLATVPTDKVSAQSYQFSSSVTGHSCKTSTLTS